jgi:glycosyltransferase involved in cell wall biosynthesis
MKMTRRRQNSSASEAGESGAGGKTASPRRVLIVGSFAPSLINFRGPLIAAMIERGHSVVAAAPAMDDETAAALRKIGAEPRELPLSNVSMNPFGLRASVAALRTLIREIRPDVLLAYTIKPVIAAAFAGRAEKVETIVSLITGAGYAFTPGWEMKRLVSRAAAYLLYRAALRRSDVVIFQNPDDERFFQRSGMVPRGGCTHVVNGSGVDLEQFSPRPLPAGASFLMIARLVKDKGAREFAEAASRIKALYPDIPIALAGPFDPSPDSLRREELDALVRSGIDYKGALSDVRPAIADCSVFVLPSAYREGTPRTVLEAMAMGRAIVTTDMPGCRDTVVEGVNGFLIPPRDADALCRAMMRFVEEPSRAEAMGKQSRRLAEEKYDVRTVNADLLRYAGLSC